MEEKRYFPIGSLNTGSIPNNMDAVAESMRQELETMYGQEYQVRVDQLKMDNDDARYGLDGITYHVNVFKGWTDGASISLVWDQDKPDLDMEVSPFSRLQRLLMWIVVGFSFAVGIGTGIYLWFNVKNSLVSMPGKSLTPAEIPLSKLK